MNAAALLDRLGRSGVRLWLDGDRLRFTAPSGSFPQEARAEIVARKPEIIALLRAREAASEQLPEPEREMAGPLSFAQRSLWFLDRLQPGNPAYIISGAYRVRGRFDPARFEAALQRVVRRHETCRTAFRVIDGEPFQIVAEAAEPPFAQIDLTALSAHEAEAEAQRIVSDVATRPFDLTQPPLLRGAAIRCGTNEWVLALAIHHIVADEWSIGVLLREVSAFYAGQTEDDLPVLPMQFGAYAARLRQSLDTPEAAAQIADWKRVLRGPLPVLELPLCRPRRQAQSFAGARASRPFPGGLADAVGRLAREEGATPFMVLLTAFLIVLSRHSGQDDIIVGTIIAGRRDETVQNLIGCFVNAIVLRNGLSGNPTARALLERVRRTSLDAYGRSETPFEVLVDALAPERELARPPLFQVAFVLENAPPGSLVLPGIEVTILDSEQRASKFDLTLVVAERSDGPVAMLDYNTDLFTASAMDRMLGHFLTVLAAMLRDPETSCAALSMLSEAEQRELARFEAGPPSALALGLTLHAMFTAQVQATPSAVALSLNGMTMTYRALDDRSNQLARYLAERGVGPGGVVGLCLDRSFDLVVAILAVLKIGGAYLPLDPAYPAARLKYMMTEAAMTSLLTEESAWSPKVFTEIAARHDIVSLQSQAAAIAAQPADALAPLGTPEGLACIIYTSGSTGAPKGVALHHKGLCNLALAQIDAFHIDCSSRVLQFASLSFDAAASEIFTALLSGATLCLAERERLLIGLGDFLCKQRISVVTLPPAVLRLLPPQPLPDLATLVVAGEACPLDLARYWAVGRRFLNAYGPAEASVCATVGAFSPDEERLPIGRPIAGVRVEILDRHGARVPVGVTGEIHISGVGVTRGYVNRTDLTAERFTHRPDPAEPDARAYATGDLGRWGDDGQIDYLGRRDQQIKLRGMRIETAEIEAALARHPAVKEALVIAQNGVVEGETRLIGYVTPAGDGALPLSHELKAWLRQTVPEHMVPAIVIPLPVLPIGPNGKIDRDALPAPDAVDHPRGSAAIAPRDDIETRLLRLWESILPGRGFGVTDSFFDLGGHSLLLVRLLALIEQGFGRELSVGAVFARPTIEALAALLRRQGGAANWSPIVELRPSAAGKPPLFCVHPIGGNVVGYLPLARRLPEGQGFYALQAPGLEARTEPCSRIEDLASLYLDAVVSVWPNGPYRLGGHSFGGLVAFEMARQLRCRDAAIDLLVMIDTPAPIEKNRPRRIADDGEWLERRARVLEGFYGVDMGLSDTAFRGLSETAQIAEFLRLMRDAQLLPADAGEDMIRRLIAVQRAGHAAAVDYRPGLYDGPVHLLRAADRHSDREEDRDAFSDPQLDWPALTRGPVIVRDVTGDHLSMLNEPHVDTTADILCSWLRSCSNLVLPSSTD